MSKLTELPPHKVPRLSSVIIRGDSLAIRTRERNCHRRRLHGLIATCRVYGIVAAVETANRRLEELRFEQRMDTKLTNIYREWVATDGPNYGLCDWETFYFNALTAIRKEDAANE